MTGSVKRRREHGGQRDSVLSLPLRCFDRTFSCSLHIAVSSLSPNQILHPILSLLLTSQETRALRKRTKLLPKLHLSVLIRKEQRTRGASFLLSQLFMRRQPLTRKAHQRLPSLGWIQQILLSIKVFSVILLTVVVVASSLMEVYVVHQRLPLLFQQPFEQYLIFWYSSF